MVIQPFIDSFQQLRQLAQRGDVASGWQMLGRVLPAMIYPTYLSHSTVATGLAHAGRVGQVWAWPSSRLSFKLMEEKLKW